MSTPREQLRKAITERVDRTVAGMPNVASRLTVDDVEAIASEVARLFVAVRGEVNEHDVTTFGDTHRTVHWNRAVVATTFVDSGTYQGAPLVQS